MSGHRDMDDQEDFDALDDFEYEEERYESKLLRWMSVGFVLLAVGGFGAVAWYAYHAGSEALSESDVPVIAAADLPMKETPADPGGWQFEHKDKSVYNELAAGKEGERPVAERILPAPEEPVQRPPVEEIIAKQVEKKEEKNAVKQPEKVAAVEAGKKSVVAVQPKTQEMKKEEVVKQEAAPVKMAEVKPVVKPVVSKPKPEAVLAPAKPKVVESRPQEIKTIAPAASANPVYSGKFMAQLGAFRSHSDAMNAWQKISNKHGNALPSNNHAVQRADLGAKGVFYRLQMGPFAFEEAAKEACGYLQQHNQSCFVVKM